MLNCCAVPLALGFGGQSAINVVLCIYKSVQMTLALPHGLVTFKYKECEI
jgi:hypothetical protein